MVDFQGPFAKTELVLEMADPITWLQEPGISKAWFRPGVLLLDLGFLSLGITCPLIKIAPLESERNEGPQDKASGVHIHPLPLHTLMTIPRKIKVQPERTPQGSS